MNNGMTSGKVKVNLNKDKDDQEAHPTQKHPNTHVHCAPYSLPHRAFPFQYMLLLTLKKILYVKCTLTHT